MAKLNNVKTLDMVNGEITRIEYGGAVYGRVADGKIQAGDVVQVVLEWGSQNRGEYFIAKNVYVGSSGNTYVEIDGNKPVKTVGELQSFIGFRKINAEQSPKLTGSVDALEARVDRLEEAADKTEFKPGDKVIAVNDNWVDAGTVGKVVENDGSDHMPLSVRFDGWDDDIWVDLDEVDLLKQTQPKTEKRRAKVGERILITDAYVTGGYYINGDILTVKQSIEGSASINPYVHVEGFSLGILDSEYEVIIEEAAPQQPRLKVGDYAKVTGSSNGFDKEDDIVKIVKYDGSDIPYENEHIDGSYAGWQDVKSLVKATDAEVEAAKAQVERKATEAKWAAIGRKPNEYKKGDIVLHKNVRGLMGVIQGVNSTFSDERYYVDFGVKGHDVCTEKVETIELVTPVEARFDL